MIANMAYSAYNQNNISIESPEKLIEMLYEGILRFASLAKKAIDDKNIEKKVYFINRTTAIFIELLNSLDVQRGGDVGLYLNGLYQHQIKLLIRANISDSKDDLDTVISVAKGLLEAWRESVQNGLA